MILGVTHPYDAVTAASQNAVSLVPLHHLRHGHTQDLLVPGGRCVHARDLVTIDGPHMQVRPRARRNLTLDKEAHVVNNSDSYTLFIKIVYKH